MLRRLLFAIAIICFLTVHIMALHRIDAMASERTAAQPTISRLAD
jgi:hypothetical protein